MPNVGIDIIELQRMQLKPELIKRYLSPTEWNNFTKLQDKWLQIKFLAKHWALKEAIYKALPHEHLAFSNINIETNEYGQATVQIKDYNIKLSLSYSQTNVIAIAIVF